MRPAGQKTIVAAEPEEGSPGLQTFRALHAGMDAAVLAAYGWTDLLPQCRCGFILDYEDEGEEASSEHRAVSGGLSPDDAPNRSPLTAHRSPLTRRGRKRPWRYRWPDEIRDEVLARLLKLNAERAQEEKLAAAAAAAAAPAKAKRARAKSPRREGEIPTAQGDFFSATLQSVAHPKKGDAP